MKNPDAIVIGAGVVGACTALSLSNAGLRVLVIDRGPVASGTTGAGEGNILVSDKEPSPELTLAIRSRDAWFEINTDIGGGFELLFDILNVRRAHRRRGVVSIAVYYRFRHPQVHIRDINEEQQWR